MIYASLIAAKCTECSKVFVIAGDLSHDGEGHDQYGAAYASVFIRGVKIIDGLGNHDVGLYAPEQTSFTSVDGVYRVPPFLAGAQVPAAAAARKAAGWDVYDLQQGHVDHDEPVEAGETSKDFHAPCGTFNWRQDDGKEPPAYCLFPFAYYYTIALKAPGTDKVVAYVVQLQNAMQSKTAVAYLTRVHDKLVAEGKQDAPVILAGHSVEGSATTAFETQVGKMNVAAILYGHYHCAANGRAKAQGHCDAYDEPDEFLNPSSFYVTNIGGLRIPSVNGNAIFHNIFWIVSLDTDQGLVKWKRINRGGALDATNFQGGSIQFLINQMGPAAYNFPTGAGFDEQQYALPIPTGKWVGYFKDGRKSTYVWSITRSGEDLTFEDVGTNTHKVKFTGKILGKRMSDGGNKIGTLSDDLQTIVWSDGVKWVRQK